MGKKTRRVRNPLVENALQWHADELQLELLDYKHVTLPLVQVAFRAMHQADDQLRKNNAPFVDVTDQKTGVYISVRRKLIRTRRRA